MFTVLVYAFRFLAIWTALSVVATLWGCWALNSLRRRRHDQEPGGRPGDME